MFESKMKIVCLVIVVNFLLLLPIVNYGQACSVSIADSPKLRGFKLGTKSEIIKPLFFYELQIPKANDLGYSKFTAYFFPLPDRYTSTGTDSVPNSFNTDKDEFKHFKGWQTVTAEYIDDKLVSIEIEYDSSVKWKNLAEFRKQFAELNNLPAEWTKKDSSSEYLDCNGFRVEARLTGQTNPTVYFVDTEAPKIMKQRKTDAEEKQKKAFKP